MNKIPKVSIIIPVRNGEKFIESALVSVMNQTHRNLEIIVIDDASTDRTPEICGGYQEVCYVRLEKNCGSSKARNVGLDIATGDFVAYLDSDDHWAPRKIEAQLYSLEKHLNKVASICGYLEIAADSQVTSVSQLPSSIDNEFFWDKPSVSPGPPSCLMVRLNEFTRLLKWDEDLVGVEDIDFVRRCNSLGGVLFIEEPFVLKRVHLTNLSNQPHYNYFLYNRKALYKMFFENQSKNKASRLLCMSKFYAVSIKGCIRSQDLLDLLKIISHIYHDIKKIII